MNEDEHALLVAAAAPAGLSVGAYTASAAVAVARGDVSPVPADMKDRLRTLADARVALNRIGNNLNQITHVLNAEGEVTSAQLAAVLVRVDQTIGSLDDATIALMDGRGQ